MSTTHALHAASAMIAVAVSLGLGISSAPVSRPAAMTGVQWTAEERAMLQSLSLVSLAPLPADPSNRYADVPAAARLGARLFFDTLMSGNGRVSCATCHQPELGFQDGIALGKGVGTAGRRTMPIAGTAYSPWQFWDGRADSQWAQALGPLESAVEHGGTRVQYAHAMRDRYRREYKAVFGAEPDVQGDIDRVYANIGKAIAAFERKVVFTPARFDRFVAADLAGRGHTAQSAFSADERAGLRLFIGKANCSTCHNGALFTDDHFHNTGVPQSRDGAPNDNGRASGVVAAGQSEFNCLGKYSDAKPEECSELRFAVTEGEELMRAFKTPSLRNVTGRAPFMHGGQLASIGAVLAHYDRAPRAPSGHSELKRLRLSDTELKQIEAFLHTLDSPVVFPRLEDR